MTMLVMWMNQRTGVFGIGTCEIPVERESEEKKKKKKREKTFCYRLPPRDNPTYSVCFRCIAISGSTGRGFGIGYLKGYIRKEIAKIGNSASLHCIWPIAEKAIRLWCC